MCQRAIIIHWGKTMFQTLLITLSLTLTSPSPHTHIVGNQPYIRRWLNTLHLAHKQTS